MRNHISEVTEAAVIEDFYRGSNDSDFVRAILQKAPTTSEQLFLEADLYIVADERGQDLIGGTKPAPPAPRCDTNQQSDRCWEKRPREEVHAIGPPVAHARGAPRGGERTLDDILDDILDAIGPQGHAPHPAELQGLQALRQEWRTVPASTASPTTRRAWRAQEALATRRGKGWSIPTR
jgi:hypothetical protein